MALASILCTYEEIAAVVKLKKRQFIDRVNADLELREMIDTGWAKGRASIRRQQMKLFMDGNATMGIWLGKQYLDQRDHASFEHSGPDGRAFDSYRGSARTAGEEGEIASA